MDLRVAKVGNLLYRYLPALYRPLYSVYKARSDTRERRLIASVLTPGMTALDLGANIGTSAEFLSNLVGPDGKVYAFEPEPRNFSMLTKAVSHRANVVLVNAAVGEDSGTLRLHISDDLNVDHHTYDDGEGRECIEVPVCRLDDYLPNGTRVDFLKSDIQGFELHALRGAQRVLTENNDVRLLLEYWPHGLQRAGTSRKELIEFLRNLGFQLRVVGTDQDTSLFDVGDGEKDYANLYAARVL